MGNPKQKWTAEEEEALRAGVAKHGAGKWKIIQRDPEFHRFLYLRSNIDLKDKWRNLSVANGQGPREKSKAPKAKGNLADSPATPLPLALTSASATPSSQDAPTMVDSSRSLPEGNNAAKYVPMIFEALSTLNGSNGSETAAIANFIEERLKVAPNFKRILSLKLNRLVQQDKLEKVRNRYRIKVDTQKSLTSKLQKDTQRPKQIIRSIGYVGDTVEEAAICAAHKIAEAENKSFVAAESTREAERVCMMAEEMESFLQFAMDCYDQCLHEEVMLA